MDAWLKPLVFGLCAFMAAPFILTQLLFAFSGWEGRASRKKRLILLAAGTILNIIGNLAAEEAALKLTFHIWNPRVIFGSLLRLRCSYQDIGSLALVLLIGTAAGLVWGWILRRLFNRDAAETPRACRAAAVLLAVCCAALVITGSAVSFTSVRRLYMTEICGHTKIRLMDPEKKEKLGDGGWEICYVRVHNPGILKCSPEVLYLSESDENPKAIAFPDMVIPAGGTVSLAVDHVHGLDLNRKNGADVYFSDAAGGLIDQVRVPYLAKDETYVMTSRSSESWEVRVLREAKEIPFTEVPAFSAESGFYPEAFDLEITAPAGFTVRYSLDGSDPAIHGTAYEGPLRIVDRTPEENVWTAREDLSGAFVMSEPEYSVPDGPVDKCSVVRAVCVDADGRTGPVVTASYFIGYEERQGYDGIGVISLTADPDDLFGDENGIFVLGKTYREDKGKITPDTFYWYYPANYHGKGRGWEREASIQFFGSDRTLLLSQQAGIRIKGGRSAGYMPKGLNLYARKEYDGNSRFGADLFGNGYRAKHLALSAAVNQLKDWLIVRMSQGLNVTMLNFRPYCLFLNGEYWGLYWLTEQFDEYYFADNYGLTEGNVVVIKAGTPKAGTEDDLKGFDMMVEKIRKLKITKAENYAFVCGVLDIDTMIDYYLIEMYMANKDWELKRNQIQWRARNQEDSPWGDTRWRPALYDLNKETVLVEYTANTLNRMKRKDPVLKRLLKNKEFTQKFYSRMKTLAEEVFTEERLEEALAEYQALMGEPMELEKRMLNWLEPDPEELEDIREFIHFRPQYMQKLWSKYLPDTAEGKE